MALGYYSAKEITYEYDCAAAEGKSLGEVGSYSYPNNHRKLGGTEYATETEVDVYIYVPNGLMQAPKVPGEVSVGPQLWYATDGTCKRLEVVAHVGISAPADTDFNLGTGASTGTIPVYGWSHGTEQTYNFGDTWSDVESNTCGCGIYGTCETIVPGIPDEATCNLRWCQPNSVDSLDTCMGGAVQGDGNVHSGPYPKCHYTWACAVETHTCESSQVHVDVPDADRTFYDECNSSGDESCYGGGDDYLGWRSWPLTECTRGKGAMAFNFDGSYDDSGCRSWVYGGDHTQGIMANVNIGSLPGYDTDFNYELGSDVKLNFYTPNGVGDGCRKYQLFKLSAEQYNDALQSNQYLGGSLTNSVLSGLTTDSSPGDDFYHCCPRHNLCKLHEELDIDSTTGQAWIDPFTGSFATVFVTYCDWECGHVDDENEDGCDSFGTDYLCDLPPPPTPEPPCVPCGTGTQSIQDVDCCPPQTTNDPHVTTFFGEKYDM